MTAIRVLVHLGADINVRTVRAKVGPGSPSSSGRVQALLHQRLLAAHCSHFNQYQQSLPGTQREPMHCCTGGSPLHIAVTFNNMASATTLMELGAVMELVNYKFYTPILTGV